MKSSIDRLPLLVEFIRMLRWLFADPKMKREYLCMQVLFTCTFIRMAARQTFSAILSVVARACMLAHDALPMVAYSHRAALLLIYIKYIKYVRIHNK